jgi:hypothetical protein
MRTGVMITPLPIPKNPDKNPPNKPVAKITSGSKNAPTTGKNNLNIFKEYRSTWLGKTRNQHKHDQE